jgi:hypothetical protein
MIFETKKTFLLLSLLVALAMPFNRVDAAIGPICGGNEEEAIREFNSTREDANSTNDRQRLRDERRTAVQDSMCELKDLFTGTAKVINYLIGFIGIFTIFRIVVSGFQMIISAGNEGMLKSAKSGLQNAIIGLLLVMLSYVIVNTIFELFDVQLGVEEEIQFPYNPFN